MTPAFPKRPIGTFECLITAEQGYPALEKIATEAEHSLWLAFRVFDPSTRLRTPTDAGETWFDLLRLKLQQGVAVRVLLADFDPIGATELHAATWASVRALRELEDEGSLQILPVRHDARVGRGLQIGFWLPVTIALEKQRRWLNSLAEVDRTEAFALRPGLWRYLKMRSGRILWRIARLPRLFPASLHQKVAVADTSVAMIGGLDVDERRYDDLHHQRPGNQTWHDVSLIVDGPIAADISAHIADVWNGNRLTMAALRREQRRRAPSGGQELLPPTAAPLQLPPPPDDRESGGGVRLIRTLSTNQRRSFFRLSPRMVVKEIEEELLHLIAGGRSLPLHRDAVPPEQSDCQCARRRRATILESRPYSDLARSTGGHRLRRTAGVAGTDGRTPAIRVCGPDPGNLRRPRGHTQPDTPSDQQLCVSRSTAWRTDHLCARQGRNRRRQPCDHRLGKPERPQLALGYRSRTSLRGQRACRPDA